MKKLLRSLWNKVDQAVFDRATAHGENDRIITVSASDLIELGITEGRRIRIINETAPDKRSAVARVYASSTQKRPGMSRALRSYFGIPLDPPTHPGRAPFRDWDFAIIPYEFDVFLCHNSKDKPAVEAVAKQLKEAGISPWFDQWELPPGMPWQRQLEEQIERVMSAAVFIGEHGIGPWHRDELDAFLREAKKRQCAVIPVILKTAPADVSIPVFLDAMTRVDFRRDNPDPMKQLLYGITGERHQ